MANEKSENLYDELLGFMEKDDKEGAKKFLTAHFKEFPKETQQAIVMAFFEDGLQKDAAGSLLISDFQAQGLATMKATEQAIRTLQDKEKLLDIKEKI